jgi:uncharacterized protein YkwD
MDGTHGRAAAVALGLVAALLSGCNSSGSDPGGSDSSTGGTAPGTTPATSSTAPAEERIARAIFDRVDDEREERGLQPLAWDATLAAVAADWSEEMAADGRLEHQDVGAVLEQEDLAGFRGIGENIFTASAPVPAGVIHVGWMESDDHRVNVLNPGWNRIGIGVHCADDGSVWATQEFGRTVDADVPAVVTEVPPQEPIVRAGEDGPSCA